MVIPESTRPKVVVICSFDYHISDVEDIVVVVVVITSKTVL